MTNYRQPIRYRCRTDGCDGSCSFDSDTFIPKDWLCPKCADALDQQMVESLYQEQLARKLVALAEDKERENGLKPLNIIPHDGPVTIDGRVTLYPGETFIRDPQDNF